MKGSTVAFVLCTAFCGIVPAPARADDPEAPASQQSFERTDGVIQPFVPAYDAWFGPLRIEPQPGRAAIGVGILMGAGLLYYWTDPLANKEDWDRPTLEDRYTLRAFRFDTNLNTTNHLLHPLAGGLVYSVGRINGLGIPASFGLGAAQSLLWELVLEWREKTSVNDLVFTTVGGVPIGELITNLTGYVNSAPGGGGTPQKIAAWTIGFPRRIFTAIDPEPEPDVQMPKDSLGMSSAYGHAFVTGYELASLANDVGAEGMIHRIRLDADIVAMPGFLRPGRFDAAFANGNFTELRTRLGFSSEGNDEADLQVRSTLFGYYTQQMERDANGSTNGHAIMAGAGPALRFQSSNWLGRHDQLSAVHLFGPQLQTWIASGDLAFTFGAEVYGDFASIQSLAFAELPWDPLESTCRHASLSIL